MCTLFKLCIFSEIAANPVHFPEEFILLNQPSDCGLDPMVPTAGRLEELGVCSGFTHPLLVPADRAMSTGWFFSSLRALLSPERWHFGGQWPGCCGASMGTTGGTEGWWKEGGFGAQWGSMACVQPLRNSHWVFQRMAQGKALVKSWQKQSVWPQAPAKSWSNLSWQV